MQLVPTSDEVVALLRRTGGLRKGHFQYPNGLHTNEHLQVALTMRHFETAKILSVGLSRLSSWPSVRTTSTWRSCPSPWKS